MSSYECEALRKKSKLQRISSEEWEVEKQKKKVRIEQVEVIYEEKKQWSKTMSLNYVDQDVDWSLVISDTFLPPVDRDSSLHLKRRLESLHPLRSSWTGPGQEQEEENDEYVMES